jgi:hypothetical protein
MRRTVVFLTLLLLAAPFVATAGMRAPGDGTLSVSNLDGNVRVWARGAIVGRCDQCTLVLDERWEVTPTITPVVTGAADRIDLDDDTVNEKFIGTNLRWRIIGGNFRAIVTNGKNVHVSVIGKGRVRIQGTSGKYVINDSPDFVPVTRDPAIFQLSATTLP